MLRESRIPADQQWEADARAEIRRRPVVLILAEQVALWERLSDEALERGNVEWAAYSQECAALAAHRLGLLEERLLDIALGRHVGPETHEDSGLAV